MGRILVSGATGFLGRNVVRAMAACHEVFALTRSGDDFVDSQGVRWVRQDLCRSIDWSRLPARIDAVFHLAQSRHYKEFPDRAEDIFDVNVNGTFRLLEYARVAGAQRFVLASSGGVYAGGPERVTESSPIKPASFYGASKHAAELFVHSYAPYFATTILRFFFIYGPGQSRMLIPGIMQKIVDGQVVSIHGNPGIRINPVFVADAVRICERVLCSNRSDVFNVAGPDTVTLTELAERCASALGRIARIQHAQADPSSDLVASTDRLRSGLGIECVTPLDAGLRVVAAEFLQQQSIEMAPLRRAS